MSESKIQNLLWSAIILLRNTGQMTNQEAASLALVRFTWTKKEALIKLNQLSNSIPATNF